MLCEQLHGCNQQIVILSQCPSENRKCLPKQENKKLETSDPRYSLVFKNDNMNTVHLLYLSPFQSCREIWTYTPWIYIHRFVIALSLCVTHTHRVTLALDYAITLNHLPVLLKHREADWWQRVSTSLNSDVSVLPSNLVCRKGEDAYRWKGKLYTSVFVFRVLRMDLSLPTRPHRGLHVRPMLWSPLLSPALLLLLHCISAFLISTPSLGLTPYCI